MSTDVPSLNLTQVSEAERAAIEEQLERLLANRHFNHSRRFPAFLKFVVSKTLSGEVDVLKERTLGVEIFGRRADYDTASDPIVRVTAAEIRKRIAQYYLEPEHENELRISLEAGSYIPQFHWPHQHGAAERDARETEETASAAVRVGRGHRRRWALVAVAVLAVAAVAATFGWRSMRRSPIDFFWGPVVNAGNPALLCIVDQPQTSNLAVDAANPERQVVVKTLMKSVNMDDLSTIVKVSSLLKSHGQKELLMKGASETTLSDLRNGPTIFVGAFDNPWTMRLTKPLRFRFGNDENFDQEWIVDSQSKKPREWFTYRPVTETQNNYREYAIVARFVDPDSGQLAVIAAGIGQGSTLMAGNFLTDAENLAELERDARAAGNKTNIEVVLSTQIIDGQPGTPKIEATYFW